MKLPKRVYVATAILVFASGAGVALALQPETEPKRVQVQQVAAVQPSEQSQTFEDAAVVEQTTAALQAPSEAPTEAPVTVTAYEQVSTQGSEDIDCKLTYSDGTTFQWHWTTVANSTDAKGRLVKTTSTSGGCDASTIGVARL